MSALIPALIELLMSGRGRGGGGGGGGGGRRGGGGGSRGGSGRGAGRGRKPFDPQEDLDKKATKFVHGTGSNPFDAAAMQPRGDQSQWNSIFKALGGELEYPEPDIPDDIYDFDEEE